MNTETTAVTTPQSFEEKMKARMRESIGDLISDDDLKKLLERGMEEVFFAPSKVKVSSWETREGPSLIHEMVKEMLQPRMDAMLKEWIQENEEKVDELLKETVQVGVGKCALVAMSHSFAGPLATFEMNVRNAFFDMANGRQPQF